MKHQFKYPVRAGEVDSEYRLKAHNIASYFQDAVANIFADHGFASYHLIKKGFTWIISNLKIDFEAPMPFWRSTVVLEVWIREIDGFRMFCDFIAYCDGAELGRTGDHAGQQKVLVRGRSCWLILEHDAKRPVPIEAAIELPETHNESSFGNTIDFAKINPFIGTESIMRQKIRSYDVDFNQHLNNIRYVAGAIETVSLDFRRIHRLTGLEILFMQEAYYNDMIESRAIVDGHKVYHSLVKQENKVELARMYTQWQTVAAGEK